MTRDEAGTVGNDEQDARVGEPRPGTMADAQDAAAESVGAEREEAARAGDRRAEAEQADAQPQPDGRVRSTDPGKPSRVRHAAEWLDGKLVPRLGPGDLGPYDEESEESVRSHDACPLCGHPMSEHTIDRSTANAVLNCPVPPRPERVSYEPLNEVGMIKRPRGDQR